MKKKIILASSGQPSLNPRLVKEANALADAGYDVTVFYAYWNDWGTKYDEQLLANSKWKAIRVGGAPKQERLTYIFSKLMYKLGQLLNNTAFAFWGISRAAYPLWREVRKHSADLYIAHNLAALPAVCKAAEKNRKPCGFDAEDFHRNEVTDDETDKDVIRKSAVENKHIPKVDYMTASSPQIADLYNSLFPDVKPLVLLNVFNNADIPAPGINKPLKIFWFSQTIGANRGIEDVVEALATLKPADFELHLLGNHSTTNTSFIDELKSRVSAIQFHAPIHPDDIINFAAKFDIGLAVEPGFSKNNDAALSNKLFTYMQAGLAVIATQTTAQLAFMQQNAIIGSTYKSGDTKALATILQEFQQKPEKLMNCKQASLRLAHYKYNWETESRKFLELVAQTL